MENSVKSFLALFVLFIISANIHAQTTNVVVIPMFGDDAAAKWRGTWSSGEDYKKGDIVEDLGSSYIATSDHLADDNNSPQDTFNAWDLVAASGANGLDGTDGAKGDTGDTGADATVDVGTTMTGEAGTPASVENVGTLPSAAVLNFTIPKGDKGDTGDTGLLDTVTLNRILGELKFLDEMTPKVTVFLSSESYNGDLESAASTLEGGPYTGADAGDALCTSLANKAGYDGLYRAWLSTSTESAHSRMSRFNQPYIRPDGVRIADNYADLTDGDLYRAIVRTETGKNIGTSVYTATGIDGIRPTIFSTNCMDWSSSSAAETAVIGNSSLDDSGWTANSVSSCSISRRLYCFEYY